MSSLREHGTRSRRFAVAFDQLLIAEEGHEERLSSIGLTAHPCCVVQPKDAGVIGTASDSVPPFHPKEASKPVGEVAGMIQPHKLP